MAQHAAAALPDAQAIFSVPFGNETLLPACFLHYGAVLGRKETLPAYIQAVREIANVHESEVFKLFPDCRIELLVNLAAVNDRRATAFFRGDHAEETDSRRPGVHVRTLVVVENRFVFRIRSGSVDLSRNTFARQVSIFGVNLVVNGRGNEFEVLRRGDTESAKQDS